MSKNSAENKILEFPKSQSLRKRLIDRTQDQKAVLGLSIVSVLVVTVFMNEWIVKSQSSLSNFTGGNRTVASFEDNNSVEGIQWEHDLAKKLSLEKESAKSLLAEKPTLKDELIFGFLEGKYKTTVDAKGLEGFEFQAAQAGEQPLVIKEKEEFLKIFKGVFKVRYSKVQLETREGGKEVYKLFSANQAVGTAQFDLDDQGRVLSLKIQ